MDSHLANREFSLSPVFLEMTMKIRQKRLKLAESMRPGLLFATISLLLSANAAAAIREDISGMYSFLRDDESIQLNLQDGRLSGWVTSFGFLESDRDTLVDRFFQKASLKDDQVYFITKPIHGCWVEFSGRVERGDVSTRAKEGYFRLVGTLTEYTTDAEDKISARKRDVVFKLKSDGSEIRARD